MSNTRLAALAWLKSGGRAHGQLIRTSRYYPAGQSWAGRPAWWFEVKEADLEEPLEAAISLLCQSPDNESKFIHILVPAAYLREVADQLAYRTDKKCYSLFITADGPDPFTEIRGHGRVAFSRFVQP